MSVNFYVAGRKHHRLFEVGSHKMPYRLHELVQKAIDDPDLRGVGFVAACATICRGMVRDDPDGYTNPDPDSWAEHAAHRAEEVVAFCEEEGWDVVVLCEADDRLYDECATDGKRWPKTHSVYADGWTCELCRKCGEESVATGGLCRDCDMDEMFESMRCEDCGNVIGEKKGIEVIDQLIDALGWQHKGDCPRRHS